MKLNTQAIKDKKSVEKLSMITCYDYSFARILDGRIDMILIGDSMGHVILGYDRTTHVRMDDILTHLAAVRRGAPNTLIVADLPAGSYSTENDALKNAQRLVDAGADAVKPEGSTHIIKVLTENGIDVMGHLGYLPQTADTFQIVGRDPKEAERLLQEAMSVQESGAFSLVLECVPATLAHTISQRLQIPTIGIGSGVECDGQVLVLYDMLGLFSDFKPKFVRRYADLSATVENAVSTYVDDIKHRRFPSKDEEYN